MHYLCYWWRWVVSYIPRHNYPRNTICLLRKLIGKFEQTLLWIVISDIQVIWRGRFEFPERYAHPKQLVENPMPMSFTTVRSQVSLTSWNKHLRRFMQNNTSSESEIMNLAGWCKTPEMKVFAEQEKWFSLCLLLLICIHV